MKKIIFVIFMMNSILILSSYGGDDSKSSDKEFGVCTTNQDSLNMMIASQVFSNKLQNDYTKAVDIYQKAYDVNKQRKLKSAQEDAKVELLRQKMQQASSIWSRYTQEIVPVSRDINAKKYQKACDSYIEIAKKYDFDITSASKTTITINELKKDGAKHGSECGVSEAHVALMFFLDDAKKEGKMDDPGVKGLLHSGGLDEIQNPNRVCEKLKIVTKELGFSYTVLMNRVKVHLEKSKALRSEQEEIKKENAKYNKKCTVNDAIELSYKQEDFRNKFYDLWDKWGNRISSIRDAKIYDHKRRKLADKRRKEVDTQAHNFHEEFVKIVQNEAADQGKYDLACENYKKLVEKYTVVLKNLKQVYIDFHDNKKGQVSLNSSTETVHTSAAPTQYYSYTEKYNAMVDVINNFSPKVFDSFNTYIKACGSDKTTRRKALYSNVAGTKIKLPNLYFKGIYNYTNYAIEHTLKVLNNALASKYLAEANSAIKEYKESVSAFLKLYSEATEYYQMKDYAEDDFKKGDKMHAPLMAAYDHFLVADQKIRDIVEKIADASELAKIEAYKSNNDLLFYYVEKSFHLANKYYKYASHKKDFMTLDSEELAKKLQLLRNHYKEFKQFKQKNAQIFKDNNEYSFYMKYVEDYLIVGKEFYLRVKSKKRYDEGEEDFLKNLPPQAKAMILANQTGSLSTLLQSYNKLVEKYNELEM